MEKKVGSVYTEYVYGAYGELFNLHDRTTWTAHIIPMGATPLAVYQDGTTRFFHANALGSTTFLTDHTGAPTQKTLFYPWGQRWTVAGTLKDERFASLGQRDTETTTWQDPLDLPTLKGLRFRRAGPTLFRLYTSGLGRWLSPDPDNVGTDPAEGAIPAARKRPSLPSRRFKIMQITSDPLRASGV